MEGLDVVGIECQRALERRLRCWTFALDETERRVTGRQIRRQRNRSASVDFSGSLAAETKRLDDGEGRPTWSEIGIHPHHLFELLVGFLIFAHLPLADLGPGVAVQRVNFSAGGDIFRLDTAAIGQPTADMALDLASDLRLQREHIVEAAVEILAPHFRSIVGADEIGTDSDPVASRADACLDQIVGDLARRRTAVFGDLLGRVRTKHQQLRVAADRLARVFPDTRHQAGVARVETFEREDSNPWPPGIAAIDKLHADKRGHQKEERTGGRKPARPWRGPPRGRVGDRCGRLLPAHQRRDACRQFLPTGVPHVAPPAF